MMQMATVRSQEIWLSGTPLFCRSVAGSALTPALALDYLGELSTDIEATVVLDREGRIAAATGDDDAGHATMLRPGSPEHTAIAEPAERLIAVAREGRPRRRGSEPDAAPDAD